MADLIILPLLSSESLVKLPPAPTNPPGPRDITNALRLTHDLVNARSELLLFFKYMYLLIVNLAHDVLHLAPTNRCAVISNSI
jgi:hypothetical protein